jgi:Family of unknown function (DUF6165)
MIDASPKVPVSWGELIDKITILEIKVVWLANEQGRVNARTELELLRDIAGTVLDRPEIAALTARLKALNETLWRIEDAIRDHERVGNFDSTFVALARSIYRNNDERGRVKKALNVALNSGLMEEKSYKPY